MFSRWTVTNSCLLLMATEKEVSLRFSDHCSDYEVKSVEGRPLSIHVFGGIA